MKHLRKTSIGALLLCTLALSVPAAADVRAGVDAWSRGDYAAAVSHCEGPATTGDADAMFNLAQAYRLGRGVALDEARAEDLYLRAAQSGHIQAADTYGLMLFQAGRREQALPYVTDAARRSDPRSQYLLGIAHFNGDLVPRDWVRAYALLTLANSSGLPQAAPAIAQMDEFISLPDRQQAAALAETMRAEADAARSAQFAAADLGASQLPAAQPQSRVPQPITNVAVSPSVAAARSAIAEASRATGTDSPANAGAAYGAAPAVTPPVVAAVPAPAPALASAAPVVAARAAVAPAPAPAATPASQSSGPWRVQLGAFSVRNNAERLWTTLSRRPELAGREQLMLQTGRVVRLQAGGYATQSEAQAACSSLQRSGQDCLVTRN